MNTLPTQLQLSSANPVFGQDAANKYQQTIFDTQINPQVQQLQAQLFKQGRADSTFGGAQLGQLQAQGALQAYLAGQQRRDSDIQNVLNARQSFFGNEGQMAQNSNQNAMQRGQFLSNFAQQNAQNANQFNMQSAQMRNNFNLANFNNQLSGYEQQKQNNQAQYGNMGNLARTGLQAGAFALNSAFAPRQFGGAPLGGYKDTNGNYYDAGGRPTGQNFGI